MWFIYSLTASFATSARVPFVKNIVDKQDGYIAFWIVVTFALPFATIAALYTGIEILENAFWFIVLARVLLDVVSGVTETKAYKFGAISYVVPLMSLSALFSTITGYLINGQVPNSMGMLAILLITISTAMLFAAERKLNEKYDTGALLKSTGYLMVTLVLWAVANALHKEGIDRSTPYTYFFFGYLGLAGASTLMVLFTSRKRIISNFKGTALMNNLFIGFLVAADRILFLSGLVDGFTGYVIAIHNTSVLFVAFVGLLLFKEKFNALKAFSILLGFLGVILFAIER